MHHHPAPTDEVAARASDGEVVDGCDRVAGADLGDGRGAGDALGGHRADGVPLGEVACCDPATVNCLEQFGARYGLWGCAGVQARRVRSRPRDEERVLASRGDGGLVAAARFARVDGDVVDGALKEPRWRRGDDGGGGVAAWEGLVLLPAASPWSCSRSPCSHCCAAARKSARGKEEAPSAGASS